MNYIGVQQAAMLLTVVLLVLGIRGLSRLGVLGDDLSRLRREFKRHLPVYSAETIQGREAEFIRDGLPTPLPTVLVLLAVVVLGAFAWWLSR
jgi:Sec-independent protein translocase protein TatA